MYDFVKYKHRISALKSVDMRWKFEREIEGKILTIIKQNDIMMVDVYQIVILLSKHSKSVRINDIT